MSNYYNMKYKNEYNNIGAIKESIFDTKENCFNGNYELTYVFYNNIIKYSLVYHKKMFDNAVVAFTPVWENGITMFLFKS